MIESVLLKGAFVIFIMSAIVPRIIQKVKKIETVGCISINKRIFFIGKAALFSSFILIHIQNNFGFIPVFSRNELFFRICLVMVIIGVALFALAVNKLGTMSLRIGLAQHQTFLRITGVYRLSRNPMLLGLYFMALGSAVYVQNPVNWLFVLIALAVHHKIILVEEVFMENRFGEQWSEYRRMVRRYL